MKNDLIDLTEVIKDRKTKKESRKLDAKASYVCLEKCLKYLEMNKLEELKDIKKQIKKTMKLMAEIGNKNE